MSGDSLGRISSPLFCHRLAVLSGSFQKKKAGYPEQGGLRGLKAEDFELRVSSFGSGPDRMAQENHKGSRGASTLIFSGAGTLRWASTCIFLSVGFWEGLFFLCRAGS